MHVRTNSSQPFELVLLMRELYAGAAQSGQLIWKCSYVPPNASPGLPNSDEVLFLVQSQLFPQFSPESISIRGIPPPGCPTLKFTQASSDQLWSSIERSLVQPNLPIPDLSGTSLMTCESSKAPKRRPKRGLRGALRGERASPEPNTSGSLDFAAVRATI